MMFQMRLHGLDGGHGKSACSTPGVHSGKEAAERLAKVRQFPRCRCQHASAGIRFGEINSPCLFVISSATSRSSHRKRGKNFLVTTAFRHGLASLCVEGGGELGEAAHLVQVHFLGHLLGVVDEVGAEECGQCQQAHGRGLGGSNGVDAFRI